jgi:mRNA-degrading endonuclease RelE of RelBE toxin-antitoxin system
MYAVSVTPAAQAEFQQLPLRMQQRVRDLFSRLAQWPQVSGIKPLRGDLRGAYRARAGDWRVLFTVDVKGHRLTVFRIANRRDVYES